MYGIACILSGSRGKRININRIQRTPGPGRTVKTRHQTSQQDNLIFVARLACDASRIWTKFNDSTFTNCQFLPCTPVRITCSLLVEVNVETCPARDYRRILEGFNQSQR
jgi:hypothetical protein